MCQFDHLEINITKTRRLRMNKTMKVGIAFAAIVFGLIASPAVAVSQTEDMKESVTLVETVSTSSMVKP